MRLVLNPGTDDEREQPATSDVIRSALHPAELWYGTEFELRPSDPEAPRLIAISVANAYVSPGEDGEFSLVRAERGGFYAAESWTSRSTLLEYFERFATGDYTWFASLAWRQLQKQRSSQ